MTAPLNRTRTFAAVAVVLGLSMTNLSQLAVGATAEETIMATLQDFRAGTTAVHTRNPDMKIRTIEDSDATGEMVLVVEYPPPNEDPAARDVWCDAMTRDWSVGSAISFRVRSENELRLSISFFGRNRVAYTSWADLKGGVWQTVRIRFDEIRPNPYFQPPGADKDSPIDVTEVARIGFSPQGAEGGRLTLGTIGIVK